jgi:Tol biopolymer transport system component
MKKFSSFFPPIVMLVFALSLLNCGNDTHTLAPSSLSNQFAFIRELSGTGPVHVREAKGVQRLRRHRLTQRGVGLQPWANDIDPGTDSVVLMNNDGTGETVVADQAGWFYSIQLSLDGKSGVFTSDVTTDGVTYEQIFIAQAMSQSTFTVTQITTDAEHHHVPQLSPDGTKIVFSKYDSEVGQEQAYFMSVSGGAETRIPTPANMDVLSPTFTPDGKGIIFEDCTIDSINRVNLDGTGMVVLNNADGNYLDDLPSASADGKYITFIQDGDVLRMDINGQNVIPLTTDGENWDAMFVNNKIVFLSYRDNVTGAEIYSMNIDGSNQKRLTNNNLYEWFNDFD